MSFRRPGPDLPALEIHSPSPVHNVTIHPRCLIEDLDIAVSRNIPSHHDAISTWGRQNVRTDPNADKVAGTGRVDHQVAEDHQVPLHLCGVLAVEVATRKDGDRVVASRIVI